MKRSCESGGDHEFRLIRHNTESRLVKQPPECSPSSRRPDACFQDQDGQPRRTAEVRSTRRSGKSLCCRKLTSKCLRFAAQGKDNAGIGEPGIVHEKPAGN
jgi:hypothetical protein